MSDDLKDEIDECLRMLDENVEILSDIELDLEQEKEDQLESGMELHDLYDMTDDVAQKAKLKRAETNFMKRQAQDL